MVGIPPRPSPPQKTRPRRLRDPAPERLAAGRPGAAECCLAFAVALGRVEQDGGNVSEEEPR